MFTRVLTFIVFVSLMLSCQNKTSNKENTSKSESLRPNILLIVADDLGFSDIAPYGGNIQTPVLSTLSKDAVLFSNFHVLPTCSPTRSAMLTGNDNHVAGVGIMHEMDYPALQALHLPGYSGSLSKQVVTIPEVLRENGYHTYMVGKWHLGEGEGMNPYDRGFEEAFILGTGGGSHFDDKKALAPPQHMAYTRNGKEVELPSDFYSTRNYTDSMIRFIGMNKDDNKPFFAFLSYTAVHDPLHAPADYVAKYKGKFDRGWDSLWVERFNNLKSLGIVPKDLKAMQNPTIPKWSSLKKEMREELARDMEVYAAMLDYMDMSIGRVIEALKANGQYENTMIIFMSDNGANGAMATSYPGNEDGNYLGSFNNHMENRGLKGSYIEQGPGWAAASSSPFRFFKGFSSEGGIKAPLMIKMPGSTQNAGQWNKSFLHVTDLMPTILELTQSPYPAIYKGNTIHPLIGKSMMPIFNSENADIHKDDGMGYELFEMKAYIKGKWKILRLPVPLGTGDWQLYDLEVDPAETTDLSVQHPDVRAALIEAWKKYAADNQVHDHKGHYDSFYKRTFSK